jgi:hypothetical protein
MNLPHRIALTLGLLLPLAGCPADDGTGNEEVGESETADTTPDTADDPTMDGGDNFCAHQCSADADCMVGGTDVGLTCQDSFCAGSASGCTNNDECVAQFSGWTTACTSGGGECDALGQVCVAAGLCATPPSDFFMCDTVPGWSEIETTDIDGAAVTVCGNANAECNSEGFCFSPCQADADCMALSAATPICDTNTGLCGCGDDSHCATLNSPANSVCNDGACGCGSDQNCVDGSVGDVCTTSGFCGCSGDMACSGVMNTFDGGMISCVAI